VGFTDVKPKSKLIRLFSPINYSQLVDQAAEIDIRCSKVSQIKGQISTLIFSKEISLEVKRTIYNTIFIPTLCYQCQTWTLDARTIRKITTTEVRCVRRMTGNSLRDRIRN
jgi:hypothetical protein